MTKLRINVQSRDSQWSEHTTDAWWQCSKQSRRSSCSAAKDKRVGGGGIRSERGFPVFARRLTAAGDEISGQIARAGVSGTKMKRKITGAMQDEQGAELWSDGLEQLRQQMRPAGRLVCRGAARRRHSAGREKDRASRGYCETDVPRSKPHSQSTALLQAEIRP